MTSQTAAIHQPHCACLQGTGRRPCRPSPLPQSRPLAKLAKVDNLLRRIQRPMIVVSLWSASDRSLQRNPHAHGSDAHKAPSRRASGPPPHECHQSFDTTIISHSMGLHDARRADGRHRRVRCMYCRVPRMIRLMRHAAALTADNILEDLVERRMTCISERAGS